MLKGLLSGVRVLDLTRHLAGPYGAMLLGDMGAEVIKLEGPGGDHTRGIGPPFVAGESAYFLSVNKNKRSVGLDLRRDEARSVFLRLAAQADVVIENYRPGVTSRLGVDYDSVRQVNPRIVYCSISGFGQDGPYRSRPGLDLVFQAMGGGLSVTGTDAEHLARMGLPMGDLGGGTFGALGIVGALYARERTGQGAHLDISCLDVQVGLLGYHAGYYFADGRVLPPTGTAHDSTVPYGLYQAADRPIVIACNTNDFFRRLCGVVGRPELADDPRFATQLARREHRRVLEPLLAELIGALPADEVLEQLRAAGVPSAPVYTAADVLNDPQVRARHMVLDVEHPTIGPWKVVGYPVKVVGLPDDQVDPPPLLGEHTDAVLRDVAGFAAQEIAELRRTGAVF